MLHVLNHNTSTIRDIVKLQFKEKNVNYGNVDSAFFFFFFLLYRNKMVRHLKGSKFFDKGNFYFIFFFSRRKTEYFTSLF